MHPSPLAAVIFALTTTAPLLLAVEPHAVQPHDSDGRSNDLRLEIILLADRYEYDVSADGGFGSLSGTDDLDHPFRIGISSTSHLRGVDYGPAGLIFAGAIYYTRLPVNESDFSERYEALSVQARIGLGVYIGDLVHVEVTPFAGIGGGRGRIDDDKSDVGLYWEYGISAGGFVTLGGSLQLGLLVGWLHGEYDLDFSDNNNFPGPVDNVNADLIHEGPFIGFSIGSRM